jgi:hypothetical protein
MSIPAPMFKASKAAWWTELGHSGLTCKPVCDSVARDSVAALSSSVWNMVGKCSLTATLSERRSRQSTKSKAQDIEHAIYQ